MKNPGCQSCKHYVLVACKHPNNVYTERTAIGDFERWHLHPLDKNKSFDCNDFEQIGAWSKFWREF